MLVICHCQFNGSIGLRYCNQMRHSLSKNFSVSQTTRSCNCLRFIKGTSLIIVSHCSTMALKMS